MLLVNNTFMSMMLLLKATISVKFIVKFHLVIPYPMVNATTSKSPQKEAMQLSTETKTKINNSAKRWYRIA